MLSSRYESIRKHLQDACLFLIRYVLIKELWINLYGEFIFAIIVRTYNTIQCYDAIKLLFRRKQVITKLVYAINCRQTL